MLDFLRPEGVIANLRVTGKKQALQELAKRAAGFCGQSEQAIFDTLQERERLGSTGVGRGIAIPHGKLAGLDKICGVFAKLERPIDFDSIDDQPVDLIFLLLAPDQAGAAHLKALAKISRMLRDDRLCETLRGCDSADGLYALMTDTAAAQAA